MNGKLDKFAVQLETEHLLGDRIFEIGNQISKRLAKIVDPQIDQEIDPDRGGKQRTLAKSDLPQDLIQACQLFVFLLNHFADPVHMLAEEAALQYAIGCGMPREDAAWVFAQHDQARAYWNTITIAWNRMGGTDDGDRYYSAMDFRRSTDAFVFLFTAHAVRENTTVYMQASEKVDPATDALVLNILQHSGPPDLTPYIGMVTRAEKLLGITPPPGSPTA